MRKRFCLWTVILFLVVGMAVAVSACGGSTAASSSTTLGATSESSTVPTGETTTTVTSDETTTSVSDTGSTTATTEAAQTTDTVDHAAEIRAQYPSTESFDNSDWTTLNVAPGSHLGATVDVKGQPANVTVDPDNRYLTWQLTVVGTGGEQMTVLCRTNVTVDRSLLSGGSPVEVKGLVVAAQGSAAGGGPVIYVESVQKAA